MKTSYLRLVFLILIFLVNLPVHSQATINPDDIMLSKDIRPGMKGYGLTTLSGNKVEKFPIEIVSVMGNKSGPWTHFPLILIRIGTESLPPDWVGFNNDIAGAPVYVNDKLIGAISGSFDWSMKDLARVRSVEEINLISDRYLISQKNGASQEKKTLLEKESTNLNEAQKYSFQIREQPPNLDAKLRALVPGDAVAAAWSIGDYTEYVKGDVTYITPDNEFYAIANSVFGRAGSINAPLLRMDILSAMEGLDSSFLVTNPGLIVGTIYEDRVSGVYGKLGEIPKLIPVRTEIFDVPYKRSYNALTMIVSDERFYPSLAASAVAHSLRKNLDVDGRGTSDFEFNIKYSINGGNQKELNGRNLYYGQNIISIAVGDLREVLNTFAANDFEKVKIDEINVKAYWTSERETAKIESITFKDSDQREKKDDRFLVKREEEISLIVRIRPYKQDLIEQEVKILIGKEFPKGKAVIQVRGGQSIAPPSDDVSKETLKAIEDGLKNRIRVIELLPPETLEELLLNLPFNEQSNFRLIELISTEKTPPRGIARENEILSEKMNYVIYGFDSIQIEITD
jgi:hypothetical protein